MSAAQNLLSLALDDVGRDLAYASSYMDLLSFCSHHGSAAREYYRRLHPVFSSIRDLASSPVSDMMNEMQLSVGSQTANEGIVVDGSGETSASIQDVTRNVIGLLQMPQLRNE
jgi:hypothetical protein